MKFYNPSTLLKVLGKAPPLVVPTLLRCICHVMIRHRFCALQAWCRSHFNQRGNDNKELKDGIYGCCSLRRSSVSVYMHGYLTIHVHYGSWDNNNFLSETGPHAFGARVGERTFLQRPMWRVFLTGNYWYHSFLLSVSLCDGFMLVCDHMTREYGKLPSSRHLLFCVSCIEFLPILIIKNAYDYVFTKNLSLFKLFLSLIIT